MKFERLPGLRETTRKVPVGVVVPVYNRAAKVLETLQSVASQTVRPACVVVVDDGSEDGTGESVRAWADAAGPELELRIVRQKHAGAAAARNTGLRYVKDLEFVAFLDSDDVWPSEFLEETVAALERESRAVAAVCDWLRIGGGNPAFRSSAGLAQDAIEWLFRRGGGILSCSLLRTGTVLAVGGLDEHLPTGHDVDFLIRVSLLGPWVHVPIDPVVCYKVMGRDQPGEGNLSQQFENRFEQWAAILDDLYRLLLERPDASQRLGSEIADAVAEKWYEAGQEFTTHAADRPRAVECFRRSLYWRPNARGVAKAYRRTLLQTLGKRETRLEVSLRPLPQGPGVAIPRREVEPTPVPLMSQSMGGRRLPVGRLLNVWRRHRTQWEANRRFVAFQRRYGEVLRPAASVSPRRRVLVVSPRWPSMETSLVLIKGLQQAGFTPVLLEHNPDVYGRYYRLAGVEEIYAWSKFATDRPADWLPQAERDLSGCQTLDDVIQLTWRGVRTGMLAVSTAMRLERMGQYDIARPRDRQILVQALARSRHSVLRGSAILHRLRPDLVMFVDTEYTPKGELFELCTTSGIDTIAGDVAHRPNTLLFKRYSMANRQDQIASLSQETWRVVQQLQWSEQYERMMVDELVAGYGTGEWYGGTRTQSHTRLVDPDTVRRQLKLDPARKTAVIFAHILWDAPFSWATPLYTTYQEWLIATVRAAVANPKVNWVIKVHPAHVGKGVLEGFAGSPREMEVLADVFGSLPEHVRLLRADSEISARSILDITDICVTVRGTVGIEAAVRGLPVVTAAKARYSDLGFTYDSATREEYLDRLQHVQVLPRLSPAQRELACRFAFGLFLMRPLRFESVSWGAKPSPDGRMAVVGEIHAADADTLACAPDVGAFAAWVNSPGVEDFLSPAFTAAESVDTLVSA